MAAAGLLNPLIAGIAMGMSSISVVANALRLRRFRSLTAQTATELMSPAGGTASVDPYKIVTRTP